MTTLGAITLSDHLLLEGLETHPGALVTQRRTLTGAPLLQVADNGGGRVLQLAGEHHWTLAQVEAVRSVAGQELTLTHHRGTYTVVVGAFDGTPAIGYADPADDDWYSGTLTLYEV